MLADTLRQMQSDGIRRALAFVTSAYSSYSGCRQYRENIAAAQAEVGEGAPGIDKLRVFYNHPGFIEACVDRVRNAVKRLPEKHSGEKIHLAVSAHSIPCAVAETSDYQKQLAETARLVAEAAGISDWDLVFQSRSGPPTQPWLEPDILDHLRDLNSRGIRNVVMAPLGFISDHMQVIYDLDTEARQVADELGMNMIRAQTVGTHPVFVDMIGKLVQERMNAGEARLSLGQYGPNHDFCPADCCPPPPKVGRPQHRSVNEAASPRP